MKAILAFFTLLIWAFIFSLLASCSVFHKSSKSSYSRVDSVVTNTVDTSSVVHKDSTYTDTKSSQNVNEVVIEGDSLSFLDLANSVTIKWSNPNMVYANNSVRANDYSYDLPSAIVRAGITGKIKKITVRSSQTASTIEGGQLSTDVIQEGHKESTVSKSVVNATSEESKSRCSFPFFWLVIGAAVVYLILDRSRIISATKFLFKL